jgi:hypothetical protein
MPERAFRTCVSIAAFVRRPLAAHGKSRRVEEGWWAILDSNQ